MKRKILLTAKWCGIFALCRRLTARDLRILCYHGAALDDEHRFRPGLFIHGKTFSRRLQHLAQANYPVLALEDALYKLRAGSLPDNAVVITIDDGWYGTYALMAPLLAQHQFPATLYVSTYYVENQTPVFNVALSYVLWRAGRGRLDLSTIAEGLSGTYEIADPDQCAQAHEVLNDHARGLTGAASRHTILRKVCTALGVDTERIERERITGFMTAEELTAIRSSGVDIQLHTHRHRFLRANRSMAHREIADNRAVLEPLAGRQLRHFCFPSGNYDTLQLQYLKDFDIESATTTQPGFNQPRTSPYELTRFLDADTVTDLEFEAELSGFSELIRRLRKPRLSLPRYSRILAWRSR